MDILKMRAITSVAVAALILARAAAVAQTTPATAKPINILLPNYNGVPVGEIASLEAGAFLARANDSSAAWFNPAGLSRAERTSVSGSAGVFEFITVSPGGLDHTGGSFQQVPALVGFALKNPLGLEGWTGGFSLSRVHAWYQAGESDQTLAIGASSQRLGYSSSAGFSGWVGSAALGYGGAGKMRLGGSVDLQLTSSERNQSLSGQLRDASGLNAVLLESEASAQAFHLRGTLGIQYDIRPDLRLGAVVRSPGWGLRKNGSYSQKGMAGIDAMTTTATFFDPEGHVEYRVPLEVNFGAAYVGRRAQIEIDVLTHGGAGTYNAFTSSRTLTVVADQGLGGPPSIEERAFVPPVIDCRSVTNVAVGGQLNLVSGGRLRLHGGYATDRSPVGPNDTVFTKIHMTLWTVGASFHTKYILGSVGVRHESGTTPDIVLLRGLQIGPEVHTRLNVSSIGLVYSIALLF